VRRVFPLLFSITLIFLRSTCTTLSTSRTQPEPSIPTALKSHRPVLSPNIEIFRRFKDQDFSTLPPRSASSTSTHVFPDSRLFLVASGGCLLRCYIEFVTHFIDPVHSHFRPAVTIDSSPSRQRLPPPRIDDTCPVHEQSWAKPLVVRNVQPPVYPHSQQSIVVTYAAPPHVFGTNRRF
jgi:hypothetical protein